MIINNKRPLIIAHKGGRYWKDNNFSYICEAIAQGADIIELDVKQKKNGEYYIKHNNFSRTQGTLENALKRVKNIPVYLDIKDYSIDPNHLIDFVRENTSSPIIIGSFSIEVLKKIDHKKKVTISYHIYSPWYDYELVKEIGADWVVLWNYNIAKWKIKDINQQGLKMAPAGNPLHTLSRQAKFIYKGANAVFVYDVARFKKALQEVEQKVKESKSSKSKQLIKKFKWKFQKNFKMIENMEETFQSHLPKIGTPVILTEDYIEYLKERFKSK